MKKRVLSLFLALTLCFSLLPTAALAEEAGAAQDTANAGSTYTTGEDTVVQIGEESDPVQVPQALIDALPEDVTAENAEEIEQQLMALEAALEALTEEQLAALDLTRYEAVCAALAELTAMHPAEETLLSTEGAAGTESDPILIGSLSELEAFRNRVNERGDTLCAQLTADITLGDSWTSIGNNQAYIGTFDGNGHTIRAENGVVNLFGNIGNAGRVQGLTVEFRDLDATSGSGVIVKENTSGTIERCSVRIYGTLTISGSFGLIAYRNAGTIEHCRGSVSNFSAPNTTASAAGIAYQNSGTIKSCYFAGTFPKAQHYAITSSMYGGTVENCYCRNDVLYSNENWYLDESLSGVHGAALQPDSRYNYSYTLGDGQVTWLLNNGEGASTNNTDPWRLDKLGAGGTPTLDSADGRVTKNDDGSYTLETLHTHTVGGRLHEFEALSSTPGSSGYYYLSTDTTLSGAWNITGETVLCLNSKTLTTGGNAITIADGGTLTLMIHDKKTTGGTITGTGTIVALQGGTLVMQGGTISGGTTGVDLPSNSTFRMEGGEITGCTTGVSVLGRTLTLSGSAKVTNNIQNILLAEASVLSFGELNADAKFGISLTYQDSITGSSERYSVTDETGGQYHGQLFADGFKSNGTGFDLYLSEDGKVVYFGKQTVHIHCICGTNYTNAGHTAHSETEFQPWTKTTSLPTEGNYYLTRNVTLTSSATLRSANICLNGYTITLSSSDTRICAGSSGSKNAAAALTDCTGKGTVTGGGVYVWYGSTFSLYNGTLNGTKTELSQTGGGTFNMYGGKITGYTGDASTVAGQNFNQIYINLYGGEISGNQVSGDCGGVWVGAGNTFKMYGGAIRNNSGTSAGGVGFTTGNTTYRNGSMTVSGSAAVKDNTVNGSKNNVLLPASVTIAIDESLTDSARIGVTTTAAPTKDSPVKIATGAVGELHYADIFTPDVTGQNYLVARNGAELCLAVHTHKWTYTANDETKTISATCNECNQNGGSVTLQAPDESTLTYDGNDKAATVTASSNWQGPAVSGITIGYTYEVNGHPTMLSPGEAPINARAYTASITLGSKEVSVQYTIEKADLTITANNNTITYGDVPTGRGVTYDGFVNGENEDTPGVFYGSLNIYFSGYSQYDAAGVYKDVICVGGLVSNNYEIKTVPGTLTVMQREVTLTWHNYENRVYGDGKSVYATAGNLLDADVGKVQVEVVGDSADAAGTFTAFAFGLTGDKAGNYKLPTTGLTQEYTIAAAGQTLTFAKPATMPDVNYGDTYDNPATNNRTDGGKVTYTSSDPAVATVDADGKVTALKVGRTTITATAAAVDGKYAEAKAEYILLVNKRPITLDIDPITVCYGENALNPAPTPKITAGSLAFEDTLETLKLNWVTAGATANVGKYKVNCYVGNDNYDLTFDGEKKLTITQRPITVEVDAVSRAYGERNPNFTANTVTSGSLVNGDMLVLTLTTTADRTSPVGEYDVTLESSDSPNYDVTVLGEKKLTVTPKSITVTVDAASRPYGGENPAFTATAPSGALVGSDTVESLGLTLSSAATATSNVGKYDVTGTANNANYTVTVEGTNALTVTAKPITVTAENKSSRVGYDLVELTYTCAPALIGTDKFSGALETTADKDKAGTYGITQGTLTLGSNYNIVFTPGTYTVEDKLPQDSFAFKDVVDGKVTKTYGDADFTIAVTGAAAGSTVTYASTDMSVVTVDAETGKVHILSAGTTTIKASADETKDYTEKEISYTLTVAPKTLTKDDLTYSGPITKVYDGSNSAPSDLTVFVKPTSLVGSDTLTITGSAKYNSKDVKDADTITFTPDAITEGNYRLAATEVLTITSASITKATPTYKKPAGVTAKYGQTLGDIALANPEGTTPGTWSWQTPQTVLDKIGSYMYDANFKPDDPNYKGVIGAAITVTVGKADGNNLKTVELTQKYTDASEHTYTPDWSGLPNGQTWSYGCESSSTLLTKKDVSAESGKLTYAISGGKAGDIVTITLKASCNNYEDFTITLNITLTEKDDQAALKLTGGTTVVYGQTLQLGTSGGSGSGAVTYTITDVDGQATIDADGKLTPVKVGTVKVKATKAADANYNAITSAEKEITITKATPTGEPKYTEITTSGKTLADAALTLDGSTLKPNTGTLEWVDDKGNARPGDTKVEANTSYKWRFTPADANYTTLTGSIELYHKSSSGGGGWYYTYHTIKATAGANGSISPSGWTSVREGWDQTFTITPDKGYAVAKVLVDGKSVGAVTSYTFKNVTKDHTIEAVFMKSNGNPQTGVFVDVPEDSYYEEAVDWAVENGITNGVSSDRFDPDGLCTRAQIVTFLWRAAGSPVPKSTGHNFTDVKAGSYYEQAVLWAVENGITVGTSSTTFSPDATCTRAQAVTFLYRASDSPAVSGSAAFSDVATDAYYADAVAWAEKKGITTGIGGGLFGSNNDCTRAQIVTFLWRAMAE